MTDKKPSEKEEEDDEPTLRISTDGDIAIGLGNGLTIDSGGHIGLGIGPLSFPID